VRGQRARARLRAVADPGHERRQTSPPHDLSPGRYGTDDQEDLRRRTCERLVLFSDAVIAIAMTLLALDLPVPSGRSEAQLWQSLAHQLGQNYLPFLISFLVTARFWYGHHSLFLYVDRADGGLTQLNLAWLLLIMLLPFATRVLTQDSAYHLSTIVYSVVMGAIGLTFLLMIRRAVRRGFTRPGTPPAAMRAMTAGSMTVAAVFLLSIPLTFINVSTAEYSWLLLFAIARFVVPIIVSRYQLQDQRPQ
jgi:uncharacterized membrane protein